MEGTGMINGGIVRQDGRKLWQYLASTSACMLAVGVGTGLAWTSPVLPQLQKPDSWLVITEEQGSWVSSLLALGAMLGAIPCGPMADKLGRKKSILLLAIPFLLSWVIIILASKLWLINIARFIGGVGVGATCVLVPTYISEIAETSTRGTLGALFQLFLTVGIVFAFVLGSMLSYTTFAIVCALVEVVFLATFVWMPESPVWLVGQMRKPEANMAMAVLRGDAYDPSEELAEMQKSVEESSARKPSISDLMRNNGTRKAVIASLGGMAFQQLSGINVVIFYTFTIFKAAGSSLPADLASIIVASVQMVMSIVAAAIVDRVGRKPLLMLSAGFMSVSLITLGTYFKLQEEEVDVSNLGWLPLKSLTLFMIAFSIGLGPIPWMLMGELFTSESKAVISSLAVMLNWFLVFVVTKVFPAMKDALGPGVTFWVFAAIMAAAVAFTYFVVPETKGKSIQQIQDELRGENEMVKSAA